MKQTMMFGLADVEPALEGRMPRRADDRPSPGERELIWPSDLVQRLGVDLLERLYGDIPKRTRLRVDEVCRRLRCSDEHVRHLIRSTSLDATDISVPDASVPCYRVYRYSLVRWLFRREFGPEADPPRMSLPREDLDLCADLAMEIWTR